MTTKRLSISIPDTSSGASELIGGVLMITVVVAAVAIISVALFSQPAPQSIPNVNFMTGTDVADTRLFLYHNGGDTLKRGEFAVVIDNDPPRSDYTISGGGDEWSVGKNLILGVTGAPQTVSVVYYGANGGTILLRSASSSVAALQKDISPSDTPIPIGGGTGGYGYIFNDAYNISNSSQFITAIEENVSAHRISFFREPYSGEGLEDGMAIAFEVTDDEGKSLVVYDSTIVKLNKSEKVIVTITKDTSTFEMFGVAPQIWELAADNVHLRIERTKASTIDESKVRLAHTWINRYILDDDLTTLTIYTDRQPNTATALTINNTRIPLAESSTVNIANAKPLPIGLYVLTVDNSRKAVYFVGIADQICVGTDCGPFGL